MPIYRLTPRNLDAPEWKASTWHKQVEIEATSEQDARIRAAMHLSIGTEIEFGKPTKLNPWSGHLVECAMVAAADLNVRQIRINDDPADS